MTPKLSIDAVLPILDSIMAVNQNSMSRLHVPKVWWDTHNERLYNFYVDNHVLPSVDGSKYEHMSKSEKRAQYLLDYPHAWKNRKDISHNKMDCNECWSEFLYYSQDRDPLYITCEEKGIEVCPEEGCGKKYCSESHADYQIKTCGVCEKMKCQECAELYNCDPCGRDLCGDCACMH